MVVAGAGGGEWGVVIFWVVLVLQVEEFLEIGCTTVNVLDTTKLYT